MELTGEKVVAAPRQRVYDALHDAVILQEAIPGCQVLTKVGDHRYQATVALRIGPLQGSFFGTIHVSNEDPPAAFSLRAAASGGLAGNASGDAHVALASIDDFATNLAYHLRAEMNGQLAALDGRQLEVAARTLVAEFFSRLETVLETSRQVATSEPTTDATGAPINGWNQRRLAAPDPSDETAYSASHYTLTRPLTVEAPRANGADGEGGADGAGLATAPATTVALTGPLRPVADADAVAGADEAESYRPLPASTRPSRFDPQPVQGGFGQRSRGTTAPEPERNGMTIWRWFLVVLGLALIAALLTGAI